MRAADPATADRHDTTPDMSYPSVLSWLRERDRGLAALRRAGRSRDRHAGDVRARRRGDRQPDARDVRRVRLVRDAAAGRLRAGRCATRLQAQAALALAGARVRLRWARWPRARAWLAAVAMALVGVRRALRRRGQLGAGRARRRRCCWRSSCRSRCRARPRRSPTGWPAGALASGGGAARRSRCCGRRRRAIRCAARRSPPAGRSPPGCAPRSPTCSAARPSRSRPSATRAVAQADARGRGAARAFFATPYRPDRPEHRRPDGGAPGRRAAAGSTRSSCSRRAAARACRSTARACAVKAAAAAVLERGADLLDAPRRPPDALHAALAELRDAAGASWSRRPRAPAAAGRPRVAAASRCASSSPRSTRASARRS